MKYLESSSLTQCCATFQLLITIDCFSKEQTKKLICILLAKSKEIIDSYGRTIELRRENYKDRSIKEVEINVFLAQEATLKKAYFHLIRNIVKFF